MYLARALSVEHVFACVSVFFLFHYPDLFDVRTGLKIQLSINFLEFDSINLSILCVCLLLVTYKYLIYHNAEEEFVGAETT